MLLHFSISVRSGNGLEMWQISNKDGPASTRKFQPHEGFTKEETRTCKAMTFSDKLFAFCNGSVVKIMDSSDFKLKASLPCSRAHILKFSPMGTYVIVYEIFISSKENPDNPNLFIYTTDTGELVQSFVMKRHSEWEPFMAQDESFFAIMLNGDVHFYEKSEDGFSKTQQKLTGKVGGFSVSPGNYIELDRGKNTSSYIFFYLQDNHHTLRFTFAEPRAVRHCAVCLNILILKQVQLHPKASHKRTKWK